MEDRQVR